MFCVSVMFLCEVSVDLLVCSFPRGCSLKSVGPGVAYLSIYLCRDGKHTGRHKRALPAFYLLISLTTDVVFDR